MPGVGPLKGLRLSARRIMALAIAIACHLALLLALWRPANVFQDVSRVAPDEGEVLELRLLTAPDQVRPEVPKAAPARRLLPPPRTTPLPGVAESHAPHVARAPSLETPAATVDPASPLSGSAETTSTPPPAKAPDSDASRALRVSPGPPASPSPFSGDGGFQQRLLDAQRSAGVRGIPGSDNPRAPGIQMIDSDNQGVGAVLRSTQRLFGITNRHCIDVEVWQSLSPQALAARHLSPRDVATAGEKYHCNRPLGLSI